MAANLRGPDKTYHDCRRCANRKQSCDRFVPQCTRCSAIPGTSCSYIRVASAVPVLAPHPLFKYDSKDSGSKYWQLTQKGQERLMEAALGLDWPSVAETVQIILVERRRTIEQLLGDDIFKWFPIVESRRLDSDQSQSDQSDSYALLFDYDGPDIGMPLLHLAILLITTPPPREVKGRPPILPATTSILYRTLKAMCATMSSAVAPSTVLAQTLGIIALYEFGHGMFEQAHLTIASAFALTSILPFHRDTETTLSWQLCLATLDRMISLSTHSRKRYQRKCFVDVKKLRLACPPSHNVSRDIEGRLGYLADPRRHPACHEPRAQKLIAVGKDIEQAGRAIQRVNNPCEDFWATDYISDDSGEGDPIDKEFAALKAQSGYMSKPESWLNHEPQALLSLSAILTRDYDPTHGRKFCSIRKPKDVAREEECQAMAIKLSEEIVALHNIKEFNIHRLSMVGMFCVMHNMAIMVKDPSYDYAHKAAIALGPAIKNYALRWPFAVDYADHITDYIQHENDLMARHRDPNYYK